MVALDVQGHQRFFVFLDILSEDDTGMAIAGTGDGLHHLCEADPGNAGCKKQAVGIITGVDKTGLLHGFVLTMAGIYQKFGKGHAGVSAAVAKGIELLPV